MIARSVVRSKKGRYPACPSTVLTTVFSTGQMARVEGHPILSTA
ncbi:hypothetical protein [Larkinella arboricola]